MKDHVGNNDVNFADTLMIGGRAGEPADFTKGTQHSLGSNPGSWSQWVSTAYLRRLEAVYAAAKDYIGAQPDSFKESRAIERLREALDPATSYDNG